MSAKYSLINDALSRTVNFVRILHKQKGVIIDITEVSNVGPGRYVTTSSMIIQESLTLLSNTTCKVEVARVGKSTAQYKISEIPHRLQLGTYSRIEATHVTISYEDKFPRSCQVAMSTLTKHCLEIPVR